MGVDPLADKYSQLSSYNYTFNNPVKFIDPDGRDPITALLEGFVSFALEAGMDFGTHYLLDGKSASESLNSVNWAAATYEGLKTSGMSFFMPAGFGTAGKLNKIRTSKLGKVIEKTIIAATEEIGKRYANGDYTKTDGSFNWDKITSGDELQDILITSLISALVDGGFESKADELADLIKNSKADFATQMKKLDQLAKKKDLNPNFKQAASNRADKAFDAYSKQINAEIKQTAINSAGEVIKKTADETRKKTGG